MKSERMHCCLHLVVHCSLPQDFSARAGTRGFGRQCSSSLAASHPFLSSTSSHCLPTSPSLRCTLQSALCRMTRTRPRPNDGGRCLRVRVAVRPNPPALPSLQPSADLLMIGTRKLSCDGGRPCGRCRQDGRECTSVESADRTPLTRKRMTELEQKYGYL